MYISTRDNYSAVVASEAIKLGMVPAGGLFVPQRLPRLSLKDLQAMGEGTYQETARKILGLYLEDFSAEAIAACVNQAYGPNFDKQEITPLHQLTDRLYVLELWHGPTAAFKDLALQLMPLLFAQALKNLKVQQEIVILVATSGDTGKAALEGFKDVPGLKIICFYPYGGVSKVQERQMLTTGGNNTYVVGVKGNFDDCQNAVKAIFGDEAFRRVLAEKGMALSSANSINWGRLLPQIVYYVYTYAKLLAKGRIQPGEQVNFVVPTGNFGNILAAWYAGRMGVPVHKLICASNENKVLTDFFRTGRYEKNRPFKRTNSPSMDILISSNLERFLFEITGRRGDLIAQWMKELQEKGTFTVNVKVQEEMRQVLWAGWADEQETLATIKETFAEKGYLLDTHTAVGMKVYRQYQAETADQTVTVLDATASPFKFASSVWEAIRELKDAGKKEPGARASGENKEFEQEFDNEFDLLRKLSVSTGIPVHPALSELKRQPVRHKRVCATGEIKQEIEDILGI
ncbi:MAG TPA: threonine synthase [Clostridia bacterium]|jgi:threonine synthase|nr:threonine synthase [Clostridia bacterium]